MRPEPCQDHAFHAHRDDRMRGAPRTLLTCTGGGSADLEPERARAVVRARVSAGDVHACAAVGGDEAFVSAANFITATLHTCPPDISRTFQNRTVRQRDGEERVDIEIRTGTAFV